MSFSSKFQLAIDKANANKDKVALIDADLSVINRAASFVLSDSGVLLGVTADGGNFPVTAGALVSAWFADNPNWATKLSALADKQKKALTNELKDKLDEASGEIVKQA